MENKPIYDLRELKFIFFEGGGGGGCHQWFKKWHFQGFNMGEVKIMLYWEIFCHIN